MRPTQGALHRLIWYSRQGRVRIEKTLSLRPADGEATAKLLASKGAKLVLGARRADKLKQIADKIQKDGGQAVDQELDVAKQSDNDHIVNVVRHGGAFAPSCWQAGRLQPFRFTMRSTERRARSAIAG